ncbi:MAG: fasciclin domain-containing protein [Ilumatobacteraceae bacterium]
MKKLIAAGAVALAAVGMSAGSANAAGDVTKTIAELAIATPELSTLVTAVTSENADPAILGAIDECSDGPVTVFAPTNDAFAAIPADTLNAVLADGPTLNNILLYHVLAGKVMAADAINADGTSVEMLNGDMMSIDVVDGGVVLNDTVNVTITDIEACNGVVHVIDAVLMPPADTPTAMPTTGLTATTGLVAAALLGIGGLFVFGARRRTVTA